MLTAKQSHDLFNKNRHYSTMPVPYATKVMHGGKHKKQRGGCMQQGGDFLGIGKAFSKVGNSIVHNPLRLAAAIGTAGLSETFLTPAQLIGDKVGVKPSKVVGLAAPAIALVRPDLGKAAGYTGTALGMMGLGHK